MKKNDNAYSLIWRDLFRIVDSIRVHSSDNRDKQFFSLTFNQLRMLHRVYTYQTENDGHGISLKALAVRLGITPAAASEMVDTLVRKSVLKRSVDAADRRAIAIVVSEELQKHFNAREDEYTACCADFMNVLSVEEQTVFSQILGLISEYAKANFDTEKDGSTVE